MEISTDTQGGLTQAEDILIEEVERLLDDLAPNEADAAALYVEAPENFQRKGSDEKAFGIPGSGFANLMGPMLVSFVVMIAKAFVDRLVKKGGDTVASLLLERLRRSFRLAPAAETLRKEKTLATITVALIEAGWEAGRAGDAAEKVWMSGVGAGQRLVTIARTTEATAPEELS